MAKNKRLSKADLDQTLQRYQRRLKSEGIPLSGLYLFGSYAMGSQRSDSDIDVAVVSPSFGKNFVRESLLVNRLADSVDSRLEAHPMHPHDLRDRWSTFAREIQKYGRKI